MEVSPPSYANGSVGGEKVTIQQAANEFLSIKTSSFSSSRWRMLPRSSLNSACSCGTKLRIRYPLTDRHANVPAECASMNLTRSTPSAVLRTNASERPADRTDSKASVAMSPSGDYIFKSALCPQASDTDGHGYPKVSFARESTV